MEHQISRYENLVVEVLTDLPTPSRIPKHPSRIEHIGLIFTLRRRRSHFEVSENGERRLIQQRETLKIPLCDNQFRAEIFNRDDDSLFHSLSCSFQNFKPEIDAEPVADALIERWIEIRDEANSRSSDRVFPMTVNLTIWHIVARYEIGVGSGGDGCGMVPACGGAVGKMLRRLEREDEVDGICVICLDELKNKKKKNGRFGLQMPCLHVFHGNCIEDWLKNSHYCPICRFEVPIQ
ncbi:E3 ubiquitin-protein ligase MPSR1, partial [Cucurbita argyrosperma subsp. sororia]